MSVKYRPLRVTPQQSILLSEKYRIEDNIPLRITRSMTLKQDVIEDVIEEEKEKKKKGVYCPHEKRWAVCMECSPSSAIAHLSRGYNNSLLKKGLLPTEKKIIKTIFKNVLKQHNKLHLRKRIIPKKVWDEIEPQLFSELSTKLPNYKEIKDKDHRMIGCDKRFFVFNIIRQFKSGMKLGVNRKEVWDVDHIQACASFDLTKLSNRKCCFNYRNYQPMFSKENKSKGVKMM